MNIVDLNTSEIFTNWVNFCNVIYKVSLANVNRYLIRKQNKTE